MASIALVGDCTSTTSLALAAGWPRSKDRHTDAEPPEPVVFEFDPTGGSLAAWLDVPLSPSLSALVTTLHHGSSNGSNRTSMLQTLDSMVRRAPSGVRFVPAPFRSREARGAVSEAERMLLPLLASRNRDVFILDVGRIDPNRIPVACRHADIAIVCHRLDASSAPAATVRLERLAETVEGIRNGGDRVAVAIIGDDPFGLEEVIDFAAPEAMGWTLALDPLAAAVFAGRTGVSSRRLARLPLARTAAHVAADLDRFVNNLSSGDVTPHKRPAAKRAKREAAVDDSRTVRR